MRPLKGLIFCSKFLLFILVGGFHESYFSRRRQKRRESR